MQRNVIYSSSVSLVIRGLSEFGMIFAKRERLQASAPHNYIMRGCAQFKKVFLQFISNRNYFFGKTDARNNGRTKYSFRRCSVFLFVLFYLYEFSYTLSLLIRRHRKGKNIDRNNNKKDRSIPKESSKEVYGCIAIYISPCGCRFRATARVASTSLRGYSWQFNIGQGVPCPYAMRFPM
jgi:hypothetical protein